MSPHPLITRLLSEHLGHFVNFLYETRPVSFVFLGSHRFRMEGINRPGVLFSLAPGSL